MRKNIGEIQMSLLGSQVFANSTTPCWLSTGGGEVEGSIAVRDTIAIVPTVTSGTSALVLGPGAAPDYPYTSLIESTPVDITTSLGSELSFYTRRNTPAIPPTLAMFIDSTQDITMADNLTVPSINGLAQKPTAVRFGTYTQTSGGTGTTAVANPAIEAGSIIYVAPAGNITNTTPYLFSANPAPGIGFASIANATLTNPQPMLYYVLKW
jgi:hypothetical protein